MFELSVALKYLVPRWRQLSVSIISLISVFVIALVVWLIVVFFSVTHGLEKSWVEKLVALSAPVRVTPTEAYYDSYYYLSDSISSEANYTLKTIGEKLSAEQTDPYNPNLDEEIPFNWSNPELNQNGDVKDLVKVAFHCLHNIPGVKAKEYEMASCQLKIFMGGIETDDMVINHSTYLSSYDHENPQLPKSLLPVTYDDARNLIAVRGEKSPLKIEPEKPLHIPDGIPTDTKLGDGVLLPKSFREAGVLIGDKGQILYQSATATSLQEQTLPIYVAGFYDPGILPLGGKIALANQNVTSIVRSAVPGNPSALSNGINVSLSDISNAEKVKQDIEEAFITAGISRYWKVETYRDFELTKNILQQLRSERNLFTLLSLVIIIVACSNIVSMLIILVNDKKAEIGILRSMGASSKSIALIFGTCGFVMGLFGSLVGIGIALFTLKNLHALINIISAAQGFEMFNPAFYGDSLPNQVSLDALLFVILTTCGISLIAGVIPAVKASLVRPSAILRSE